VTVDERPLPAPAVDRRVELGRRPAVAMVRLAALVAAGGAVGTLETLLRSGPDEGRRRAVRLGCGTGVLGGFTTFSTFAVETLGLAGYGRPALAAAYALGSVVLGGGCGSGGDRCRWRRAPAGRIVARRRPVRRRGGGPVTVLLLAVAGGVGAAVRFVVDTLVSGRCRWPVPMGTFVVNATACLLLGLLTGWLLAHGAHDGVEAVLGVGFLGGYSTFSAASVEGARLLLAGRGVAGVLQPAAMLVTCLAAAAVGLLLAGSSPALAP
jgi:CrcB protein